MARQRYDDVKPTARKAEPKASTTKLTAIQLRKSRELVERTWHHGADPPAANDAPKTEVGK
jgi:hypothetical protein